MAQRPKALNSSFEQKQPDLANKLANSILKTKDGVRLTLPDGKNPTTLEECRALATAILKQQPYKDIPYESKNKGQITLSKFGEEQCFDFFGNRWAPTPDDQYEIELSKNVTLNKLYKQNLNRFANKLLQAKEYPFEIEKVSEYVLKKMTNNGASIWLSGNPKGAEGYYDLSIAIVNKEQYRGISFDMLGLSFSGDQWDAEDFDYNRMKLAEDLMLNSMLGGCSEAKHALKQIQGFRVEDMAQRVQEYQKEIEDKKAEYEYAEKILQQYPIEAKSFCEEENSFADRKKEVLREGIKLKVQAKGMFGEWVDVKKDFDQIFNSRMIRVLQKQGTTESANLLKSVNLHRQAKCKLMIEQFGLNAKKQNFEKLKSEAIKADEMIQRINYLKARIKTLNDEILELQKKLQQPVPVPVEVKSAPVEAKQTHLQVKMMLQKKHTVVGQMHDVKRQAEKGKAPNINANDKKDSAQPKPPTYSQSHQHLSSLPPNYQESEGLVVSTQSLTAQGGPGRYSPPSAVIEANGEATSPSGALKNPESEGENHKPLDEIEHEFGLYSMV